MSPQKWGPVAGEAGGTQPACLGCMPALRLQVACCCPNGVLARRAGAHLAAGPQARRAGGGCQRLVLPSCGAGQPAGRAGRAQRGPRQAPLCTRAGLRATGRYLSQEVHTSPHRALCCWGSRRSARSAQAASLQPRQLHATTLSGAHRPARQPWTWPWPAPAPQAPRRWTAWPPLQACGSRHLRVLLRIGDRTARAGWLAAGLACWSVRS